MLDHLLFNFITSKMIPAKLNMTIKPFLHSLGCQRPPSAEVTDNAPANSKVVYKDDAMHPKSGWWCWWYINVNFLGCMRWCWLKKFHYLTTWCEKWVIWIPSLKLWNLAHPKRRAVPYTKQREGSLSSKYALNIYHCYLAKSHCRQHSWNDKIQFEYTHLDI